MAALGLSGERLILVIPVPKFARDLQVDTLERARRFLLLFGWFLYPLLALPSPVLSLCSLVLPLVVNLLSKTCRAIKFLGSFYKSGSIMYRLAVQLLLSQYVHQEPAHNFRSFRRDHLKR
jgi:hypothetical protein